jgi:tryptophan-rich sensory protein
MHKNDAALLATGAVLAAALIGGRFNPANVRDATWYAHLEKPEFRPSPPVIGAAWTALDVLLAYAGTRLLSTPPQAPGRQAAVAGWGTAVGGLVLYPWLMFGRHRLGAALGAVAVMLGGTLTAVAASPDRRAARALLPLLGWLGFAGVLQEEIWRSNR